MGQRIVAVTGAGGYVGGAVCVALAQRSGWHVRGLVRREEQLRCLRAKARRIQPFLGDIRDASAVERLVRGTDIVLHCAAKLGRGSMEDYRLTNVEATAMLAAACARQRVRRFAFVSSIEAFGRFRGRALDEDVPPQTCGHPYADSKALAESAVWQTLAEEPTEVTIIRPGMVYGPGSPYWTVRLSEQILRKGVLEVVGGGDGCAYPIYIEDLVDGIVLCLSHAGAANQTFNFVNERPITWREWYEDYLRMHGLGPDRILNTPYWIAFSRALLDGRISGPFSWRHLEVMTRRAAITQHKAIRLLGWTPRYGYAQGMTRTQDWLSERRGRFPLQTR